MMILFLFAAGEMDLHCFNIDYFPKEEYSPDPNDSTMAIPCKCQGYKPLGSRDETVSVSCLTKDRLSADFI
jgi:hypothetical protein